MSLGNKSEELQQLVIDNFTPGLVSSIVDTKMPVGSGDIAQNLRYNNEGGLTKRYNRAKYNGTSLGANPIMYAERIYIGSNKYLIAVYTTKLKVGDDAAGTFSDLDTVTTSLRYTGVTFKDFHYLFNGTDSNIKTNGVAATTDVMGCTTMTAAPTGAKSSTGSNLDEDTYKYQFTWEYDSYQEASAAGGLTVATDASNLSINLYAFETAPANATHVRIYRTEGGGSAYYYHSRHTKTAIAGYSVGSPYNDDLADGSLDNSIEAPTDNGTPPICKYGVLHKDRIYIAGNSTYPSRVYYSKIASNSSYPDIFPSSNYIDVASDDGDLIQGLAIDPTGNLCVIKINTIRKIYTDGDPINWSVSEPFSYAGAIAPYSISESPYGIFFLSRQGESGKEIRMFDGQNSKSVSDKVHKQVDLINKAYVTTVIGHYHEGKYFMAYTDSTAGHTYNDRVLIYDIARQAYSIDIKSVNAMCSFYGSDDRGELYSGDSVIGQVYREDSTSYDLTQKLKSELDTGAFTDSVSGGTEGDPTVTISGTISDQWGATNWEDLDSVNWEDETAAADTWYPGGYFISDYLQVDAASFSELFWSETLGANGHIAFYLRSGDTTGAVDGASWSGPYSTSGGTDISAVSGAVYVQYRCHVLTNDTAITATPILKLDSGYVLKIGSNSGTEAETAIPFEWQSGQMDLGLPRQRKRLRGVRIEYESDSAGTLNIYYAKDRGSESNFAIDLATYPTKYTANFAYNDIPELLKLRFYQNDNNKMIIKRVVLLFSAKPPLFTN